MIDREIDPNVIPEVLCPECWSSNTHHEAIVAFERPAGEDTTTVATVVSPSIQIQNQMVWCEGADTYVKVPENPSLRRNGIAILFWCENGRHTFWLTIAQHKGETHVRSMEAERP